MPLRHVFASRLGLAAAVAVVVALAVGGGLSVRYGAASLEAEIPALEAGRLRDGLVALADLNRVALALADTRSAASGHDPEKLSAALDFLHVRAEALTVAHTADAPSRISADFVRELVASLRAVVAAGDTMLAVDARHRATAAETLAAGVAEANAHVVRYVNWQQQAQTAAIGAQASALRAMSLSSETLLVVFAVIASMALVLLRRELLEQLRRRVAERRAHFLAYHDAMTGLLNRTSFTERADAALAARASGGPEPTLVLIDLDGFKAVNDVHGHATGDAVLRAVAVRIGATMSACGGVAARLGGDEFATICTVVPTAEAQEALCRRLLDAIRAPLTVEGVALVPRASIGLATADGAVTLTSQLLKQADLALYEAKRLGRDGHAIYAGALVAAFGRRSALERDLGEALARDELFLVYQPQVRLVDGTVYGFEALARWRRTDGVVQPGEFIGLADQTGHILDIDVWGVRAATRWLARWRREHDVGARISVNLSPLHFRSDAIVGEVACALAESGLPPQLLTLEITETVLLHDWQVVSRTIEGLHALGVRIALDDFGSGYSSLNYLRRLSVDQLKIDRSFVLDLETSAEARAILGALVGLSSALSMELLVEGVETQGQRRMLQELGCAHAQGYFFSRPIEADAAARLIGGASPVARSSGPRVAAA